VALKKFASLFLVAVCASFLWPHGSIRTTTDQHSLLRASSSSSLTTTETTVLATTSLISSSNTVLPQQQQQQPPTVPTTNQHANTHYNYNDPSHPSMRLIDGRDGYSQTDNEISLGHVLVPVLIPGNAMPTSSSNAYQDDEDEDDLLDDDDDWGPIPEWDLQAMEADDDENLSSTTTSLQLDHVHPTQQPVYVYQIKNGLTFDQQRSFLEQQTECSGLKYKFEDLMDRNLHSLATEMYKYCALTIALSIRSNTNSGTTKKKKGTRAIGRKNQKLLLLEKQEKNGKAMDIHKLDIVVYVDPQTQLLTPLSDIITTLNYQAFQQSSSSGTFKEDDEGSGDDSEEDATIRDWNRWKYNIEGVSVAVKGDQATFADTLHGSLVIMDRRSNQVEEALRNHKDKTVNELLTPPYDLVTIAKTMLQLLMDAPVKVLERNGAQLLGSVLHDLVVGKPRNIVYDKHVEHCEEWLDTKMQKLADTVSGPEWNSSHWRERLRFWKHEKIAIKSEYYRKLHDDVSFEPSGWKFLHQTCYVSGRPTITPFALAQSCPSGAGRCCLVHRHEVAPGLEPNMDPDAPQSLIARSHYPLLPYQSYKADKNLTKIYPVPYHLLKEEGYQVNGWDEDDLPFVASVRVEKTFAKPRNYVDVPDPYEVLKDSPILGSSSFLSCRHCLNSQMRRRAKFNVRICRPCNMFCHGYCDIVNGMNSTWSERPTKIVETAINGSNIPLVNVDETEETEPERIDIPQVIVKPKFVSKKLTVNLPIYRKDPTRLIPRIIHQSFAEEIDRDDYPILNRFQNSFKQSGWEYRLYNDTEMRDFIVTHFPEEVVEAYDALIPEIFKTDLFRYCVLLIHGGLYADIDKLMESNPDASIPDDVGFTALAVSYGSLLLQVALLKFNVFTHRPFSYVSSMQSIPGRNQDFCVHQVFIASAPGHPFLVQVIQDLVNTVRNRRTVLDMVMTDFQPNPNILAIHGNERFFVTGPCLLGPAINKVLQHDILSNFNHGDLKWRTNLVQDVRRAELKKLESDRNTTVQNIAGKKKKFIKVPANALTEEQKMIKEKEHQLLVEHESLHRLYKETFGRSILLERTSNLGYGNRFVHDEMNLVVGASNLPNSFGGFAEDKKDKIDHFKSDGNVGNAQANYTEEAWDNTESLLVSLENDDDYRRKHIYGVVGLYRNRIKAQENLEWHLSTQEVKWSLLHHALSIATTPPEKMTTKARKKAKKMKFVYGTDDDAGPI